MHLTDLLRLRSRPAAGVFFMLTTRCPLSCPHCSTSSTMSSEESDSTQFLRFVDGFSLEDRPDLVLLTGGEPLLQPGLVTAIARRSHDVGTRVAAITGMFFARARRLPRNIEEALGQVDHLTASIDSFHEREVPRERVFAVMAQLLERGVGLSVQTVATGPSDRYVLRLIADVRKQFHDRVPVLVAPLQPIGRGRDLAGAISAWSDGTDLPGGCTMAAWPVVAPDGHVVACCNQSVVEGPAPRHLAVGHVRQGWPRIRAETLQRTALRGIRVFGPMWLAPRRCLGYCDTCRTLSDQRGFPRKLQDALATPGLSYLELKAQDDFTFERDIHPSFRHLIRLGEDIHGRQPSHA
jgi:pyruvate-formate lyase-activating enzyme